MPLLFGEIAYTGPHNSNSNYNSNFNFNLTLPTHQDPRQRQQTHHTYHLHGILTGTPLRLPNNDLDPTLPLSLLTSDAVPPFFLPSQHIRDLHLQPDEYFVQHDHDLRRAVVTMARLGYRLEPRTHLTDWRGGPVGSLTFWLR